MKKNKTEFFIDKNRITPQTINVFNKNIGNILKIQHSIIENLITQVYNNLDIKKEKQTVDVCIFIDHTEKLSEPLLFKEIMISQVLNKMKIDRKINSYRFLSLTKMVSVFEIEDSDKTKKMEDINVSISVIPKDFKKYYEKMNGKKINLTDKPILDISKFKKYLKKEPSAKQVRKMIHFFFLRPRQIISEYDMLSYLGTLENKSANGGKIIYNMKCFLKDKEIIESLGDKKWRLNI